MAEHYRLEGEGIPSAARVVCLQGRERISDVYRFDVVVLISEGEFPLDGVVASRATLTIGQTSETPLTFHGVVSSIENVHEWEGVTVVRIVLVPALFQSGLNRHSRVFVDKTVLEIATETLERNGLASGDYVIHASDSHAPREFVCQYQESDYAFLARQLERAGLYFFFEQGDEREKLIITDDKGVHGKLRDKAVRYVPSSSQDASAFEVLRRMRCQVNALPSSVEMNEYDYLHPDLDLAVTAPIPNGGGGSLTVAGANYASKEEGNKLAATRAGALLAQQRVYHCTGNAIGIRAGYLFAVEGHPRAAFDREYLATGVKYYAREPDAFGQIDDALPPEMMPADPNVAFEIEVECIESSVQYRSPFRCPMPRVDGNETGIIDGEGESDFAQIDEHGRYKVRFKFDESGEVDGKASAWVRMMQPTGGGTEGVHFPLRKGTEVLLSFLAGDPDRPVIAGAAPNAHKPSPVDSGSATKNVLQSGSGNRVEMDDDKPYIDISSPTEDTRLHLGAPHDGHAEHIVLNTAQDSLFNFGTDFDTTVGGEMFQSVGGDVTTEYLSNELRNVSKNRTLTVNGSQSVVVAGGNANAGVTGASLNVTGDYRVDVSNTIEIQAPKHIKMMVGDSQILIEPGKITIAAGDGSSIVLDANVLAKSSQGSTVELNDDVTATSKPGAQLKLSADAAMASLGGGSLELTADATLQSAVGSQLALNDKATMTGLAESAVSAPIVKVSGQAETEITGGGGASVVKMNPAQIEMQAPLIKIN